MTCEQLSTHGVMQKGLQGFTVRDVCERHAQKLASNGWVLIGPVAEDYNLTKCTWDSVKDELQ